MSGFGGDYGPATKALLSLPEGVAVGPDGTVWIADTNNRCLRLVDYRSREISTLGCGYTWESRPTNVAVSNFDYLDATPFLNLLSGSRWIAGTGVAGFSGDDGPATEAQLWWPYDATYAPDGSVLIADTRNNRVRRVGPDGIITTVAGDQSTLLSYPSGVAVAPDGSIYIADTGNLRIRKVNPGGTLTTVAGTGSAPGFSGDGGPATRAQLSSPYGATVAPDGSVLIADTYNNRIRQVSPDGTITTVAGGGFGGDGGSATQAGLYQPHKVAVAPDGSLYIADTGNNRIRKVAPPLPGFNALDTTIASADGRQLYRFSAEGRHLNTVDTLTNTVLYTFGYDSAGRLIKITDADNNVLTIERDGSGKPQAIVAPFGQRTTLSVDGHGYLNQVTNPAGEAYQMSYTADGLLTHFTDPRSQFASMKYDPLGRLISDTDPAGGSQTLARTQLANGNGYTPRG